MKDLLSWKKKKKSHTRPERTILGECLLSRYRIDMKMLKTLATDGRPFSEWAWAVGQAAKVQISALLVTSCVILDM